MTQDFQLAEAWMRKALAEAEFAEQKGETPIGAIVLQDGKIIGRGHNLVESMQDPTAHAEMIAITAAANTIENWRLDASTLVVTKEPCPMCAGAIVNARIPVVYFGFYDEKMGACSSHYQICRDPRLGHQCTISGGILENECLEIVQRFFYFRRSKSDEI